MEGSRASRDARSSRRLVPADLVVLPADVVVQAEPGRVVKHRHDTDLGHGETVKLILCVLQRTWLSEYQRLQQPEFS
jgi:hypothetical protein